MEQSLIVFFNFQLKKKKRIEYLQKIISLKKIFFGALENLKVSNHEELEKIEEIWDIKNNLQFCPKNISKNTNKKI